MNNEAQPPGHPPPVTHTGGIGVAEDRPCRRCPPIAHIPKDLIRIPGIDQKTALAISGFFRQGVSAGAQSFVDDQLERMQRREVHFVSLWHDDYPPHLRKIYDPPPFLFLRGTLVPQDAAAVAIVGTRTPSPYGIRVAERFGAAMAARGITVVSGLARGIDTAAHAAALRAGGRTIAVIGSGLDVLYPPENRALAGRIKRGSSRVSRAPSLMQ
jgi:DNA processing protein